MSKFSGKFDFYDYLHSHNFSDEDLIHNLTIYVGKSKKPIKINDKKDLIQYYPYVLSVDSYDKENKVAVIRLTDKSWVDTEEEESLTLTLNEIKKIYKKCKKKKIPFETNEVLKEIYHTKTDLLVYTEMINRVKEDGNRANIKELHLIRYKYLRDRLHAELDINGVRIKHK